MFKHRLWFTILWPSFLMACVLEILVFAVVDPAQLHGLDGTPLGGSPQAIYTLGFLVFWAVIAVAGALSALLSASAASINRPPSPGGAPMGPSGP